MIELNGDWLMFNGERLVELPANLRIDIRRRFEDWLNRPMFELDLLDTMRVLITTDDHPRILGSYPDDHRGKPVLPDDTDVIEVVNVEDIRWL